MKDLKEALVATTELQICDPDKPVLIQADVSKYAIGAVLQQEGRPITFESERATEPRLPVYESEMRPIAHAPTKRRQFRGARTVTIETDHATLRRILKQRQDNARLGYRLDKILDSNTEAAHKPGKQNVAADAISRRPGFVAAISGIEGENEDKQKGFLEAWFERYQTGKHCMEPWEETAKMGAASGAEAKKAVYFIIENIGEKARSYGQEPKRGGDVVSRKMC